MKFLHTLGVLLLVLVVGLLAFGASPSITYAQEIDPTCTDGIDNDGDTVIDGEDPSCTTLSEQPAVTPVPTAEPTAEPTAAPTAEPDPEPTATPATPPDTGGFPNDPGSDDGVFEDLDPDTGGPAYSTDMLASSAIAGFIISAVVMALVYLGLANSSIAKQAVTVGLSIAAGLVLAATQDGVKVDNAQDVLSLVSASFGFATVAYVFVSRKIQEGLSARTE